MFVLRRHDPSIRLHGFEFTVNGLGEELEIQEENLDCITERHDGIDRRSRNRRRYRGVTVAAELTPAQLSACRLSLLFCCFL